MYEPEHATKPGPVAAGRGPCGIRRAAWRAVLVAGLGLGLSVSVQLPLRAAPSEPSVDQPPVALGESPAWIVLGGGYDPLSNQISIAQDLQLAASLLRGPGVTLFAGGAFSPVAVIEPGAPEDPLGTLLEELLGEPAATGIAFRDAGWSPDGPATAAHVLDLLNRATREGDEPLLVYAAGHGEGGESPAEVALLLWGGWSLLAEDVGELLDDPATLRPLRLVVTSCYGGGFADIVNHGGELGPEEGEVVLASYGAADAPSPPAPRGVSCGVFAATWDDESSGCDPDPERAAQESYALHFLHALAGQDRNGRSLPRETLDLDGDGRIGLSEAHTQARIASRSIDQPTTTSEHWLRVELTEAPIPAEHPFDLLPEDTAVIRTLGPELGLAGPEETEDALAQVTHRLSEVADLVDLAQEETDDGYWALRIALLERWPQLSKAWDPETAELVRRERPALLEVATRSGPARRYAAANARLQRRLAAYDRLRLRRARIARLARAWETLRLAAALRDLGGPSWNRYLDLLACERWVPPVVGSEVPAP